MINVFGTLWRAQEAAVPPWYVAARSFTTSPNNSRVPINSPG